MEQRSYNQYCATARTLDLVGERWTLLLIRELLTGPKRFSDLQASLRGLGTGLLAARLKHLEREGLAEKITLPPPARTPAYALTEAGAELRVRDPGAGPVGSEVGDERTASHRDVSPGLGSPRSTGLLQC